MVSSLLLIVVPSRPTSPEKFSVPHICARFGPGGQLIKVIPNLPSEGQPALVEIHSMEVIPQHGWAFCIAVRPLLCPPRTLQSPISSLCWSFHLAEGSREPFSPRSQLDLALLHIHFLSLAPFLILGGGPYSY